MSLYLIEGDVFHKRFLPKTHGFTHSVYSLCFDVDKIDENSNTFFSVDRPNPISFYRKDHGRKNQDPASADGDLRKWILEVHKSAQVNFAPTEIWLHCYPRVLGYVFNPISVWYCYDDQRRLRTLLCEVNNTFGETHNYLLKKDDLSEIQTGDVFWSEKCFHVSPFFPVKGEYRFKVTGHPNETAQPLLRLDITYFDNKKRETPTLVTWMRGEKSPLTTTRTLQTFFNYPLLTLKVISLIHFHAILLWWKRATFFRKPKPPDQLTT